MPPGGSSAVTIPGKLQCIVFRASGLRLNSAGEPPDCFVRLRILTVPRIETGVQCETVVVASTTDPSYNEEFTLNVPNATCSQLEITLWDKREEATNAFLGQIIEQDFDVKQGKQYKSKIPAKGKLMMQLEFSGADQEKQIDTQSIDQEASDSLLPPVEKPQTPRPPEARIATEDSVINQQDQFAIDVNILQASNLIKSSGVYVCISFIHDPSAMEQHHFLLLDHAVGNNVDPNTYCIAPQFRSKSMNGVDVVWNESCRLLQAQPSIQAIEQAHRNDTLHTMTQLFPLGGKAILMLITVHATDPSGVEDFCGRIIIPKLHSGHPADQWFMLQGKDGMQLKGPNGQPSALRLQINYGNAIDAVPLSPVSPTPAAAPDPIQLPPGWEQKLDPSGKTFYVNHQLRTFSWTPPPLPIATPPPASARPTSARPISEQNDKKLRQEQPGRSSQDNNSEASSLSALAPSPHPSSPGIASQIPRGLPRDEFKNKTLERVEKPEQKQGSFQTESILAPFSVKEEKKPSIDHTKTASETHQSAPTVPNTIVHASPPNLPEVQENMDWRILGKIVAARDLPKLNPSALSSPFLCISVLSNAESTDPKQQDRVDHFVNPNSRNEMFTSKGRICRIHPQHTSRVVQKTLNPNWNEDFCLLDSHLDFQTLDRANQVRQSKPSNERLKLSGEPVLLLATIHDSAKDDCLIGRFVIPSVARFTTVDQWINLMNQDGKQHFGINGKPSAVCLRFAYEQYPRPDPQPLPDSEEDAVKQEASKEERKDPENPAQKVNVAIGLSAAPVSVFPEKGSQESLPIPSETKGVEIREEPATAKSAEETYQKPSSLSMPSSNQKLSSDSPVQSPIALRSALVAVFTEPLPEVQNTAAASALQNPQTQTERTQSKEIAVEASPKVSDVATTPRAITEQGTREPTILAHNSSHLAVTTETSPRIVTTTTTTSTVVISPASGKIIQSPRVTIGFPSPGVLTASPSVKPMDADPAHPSSNSTSAAEQIIPLQPNASPKNEGHSLPQSTFPDKPRPHQAKIVVTIIEGRNFPRSLDNYLCDHLCEVCIETKGLGADIARTTVSQNRTEPMWNEQFIFGIDAEQLNASDLRIQLLDWNAKVSDKIMGYIPRIPIGELVKRRQINTWFDVLSPIDGKRLIVSSKTSGEEGEPDVCALHIVLGFEMPLVQAVIGPAPVSHITKDAFEASSKRPVEAERPVIHAQRGPEHVSSPLADNSENAGVGIAMKSGPRREHVIEFVIEGGPAAVSRKVLPGDVLMDIDGLSTANKPITEVQALLTGKPGSPVTMTLARAPENVRLGSPSQVVVTLMRKKLSTLSRSPPKGAIRSPGSFLREAAEPPPRAERSSPPARPAAAERRQLLVSRGPGGGSSSADPYVALREEFASLFRRVLLPMDRMDPEMVDTDAWARRMLHGV